MNFSYAIQVFVTTLSARIAHICTHNARATRNPAVIKNSAHGRNSTYLRQPRNDMLHHMPASLLLWIVEKEIKVCHKPAVKPNTNAYINTNTL